MDVSCLSQRTNGSAHLYGDSNYAHFSQITEANKKSFPDFEKAHPITITLEKGDVLYIPAKWWHWVKSFGKRCISINYWFSCPLGEEPKVHAGLVREWPALQKWTNPYLEEVSKECNRDGIWIWRENFAYKERITMDEFISRYGGIEASAGGEGSLKREPPEESKNLSPNPGRNLPQKEFAYLITLADYECSVSGSNGQLLVKLSEDISFPFPDLLAPTVVSSSLSSGQPSNMAPDEGPGGKIEKLGSNFWMNFGGIDTGLHFDDEDGFLCVVDGTKQVTLYPPQDSIYLAPYPLEKPSLLRNHRHFMYNLYLDFGPLQLPTGTNPKTVMDSSSLLELTLKKAPNLARYARQLQDHFGAGRIVYGVKNRAGVIQWEFYFYGIDKSNTSEQDRSSLFATPAYNQDLHLREYLKFHAATLHPQTPLDPQLVDKIDLAGLTVYSVDFNEESAMTGNLTKINIYRTATPKIAVPFALSEYTYNIGGENLINSVQYIALFTEVFSSSAVFETSCVRVGIQPIDIANLAKFCNGAPYVCRSVSLVNKREEIGIYFFGISYATFLKFLIDYQYPPDLFHFTIEHSIDISRLQLEVGFHFPKGSQTGVPSRTAFYGLF
jgi:hypothetical protein